MNTDISNIITTKYNNNIFELKFKNENNKLYALLFKYKTLQHFIQECIFPIIGMMEMLNFILPINLLKIFYTILILIKLLII